MHILVTGASGLLGQGVLEPCLASAAVTRVTVLARQSIHHQHPKLQEILLPDFAQADTVQAQLAGMDACFYCAGAPPVGTRKDTYRHVTLELTLAVARAYAAANPQGKFLYVSGAHSDAQSRVMPLRIKGETEDALRALPLTTVMLRPGGILPETGTQSPHATLRLLHRLARPLQATLLHSVPAAATSNGRIGRAMLALAAMQDPPGIVENRMINALASAH